MSETPENTTAYEIASATTYSADHPDRRLRRVLAWVGIVAGVVFIVAVVFFSGFALGRGSGGYHGWHRGYHSQMGPGGGMDGCPMMRNGGGMMDPDDMGPGMMRPGQSPASPNQAPPQR